MREIINQDKLMRRGMWIIAGLVLVAGISVWWIGGRVPPQIPLFYSRPWGEGQLAGREIMWWLWGGLAGAGVLSAVLGAKMWQGQKTVARIIVWTAVLIEVLGLLAVWNVWWRVGV